MWQSLQRVLYLTSCNLRKKGTTKVAYCCCEEQASRTEGAYVVNNFHNFQSICFLVKMVKFHTQHQPISLCLIIFPYNIPVGDALCFRQVAKVVLPVFKGLTMTHATRSSPTNHTGVRRRYNPKGWVGYGEYRPGLSAFLFTWRDGDTSKRAMKLRKVSDQACGAKLVETLWVLRRGEGGGSGSWRCG